jgi:hypothetical protein
LVGFSHGKIFDFGLANLANLTTANSWNAKQQLPSALLQLFLPWTANMLQKFNEYREICNIWVEGNCVQLMVCVTQIM